MSRTRTRDNPMEIYRTRLGSAALASIAGLCLVTLASCGGGGGGRGGGGVNPTTMQITPLEQPGSFLLAQINELPEEDTFTATLDSEDQSLVYGLSLEAGDIFGVDITVEGRQEQVQMRVFFGQFGEEIPTFELEGGGMGFDAPSDGVYFIEISSAQDSEGALSRSSDAPKVAIRVLKFTKAIFRGVARSGPGAVRELRKGLKEVIEVLKSDSTTRFDDIVDIAARFNRKVVREAIQDLTDVFTTMVRADIVTKNAEVRCPPEPMPEMTPAFLGDTCSLEVRIANEGDFVADLLADLSLSEFYDGLPWLRFYRSTDSTISPDDTQLEQVKFNEWKRSLSSVALGRSFPERIQIQPPMPGTFYYGACHDPVFLERGTGRKSGPFADLTENNCSEGVELVVEEVPIVSITDAGSVVEGDPLVFTVSLEKVSGREVMVDWRLSGDVDSEDFIGLTIGTLSLSPDTSGTLTFSPGEMSKTITLMTREDQSPEGMETGTVTLSVPVADPNAEPPEPPVTPVTLKTQAASGVIGDVEEAVEGDPLVFTVSIPREDRSADMVVNWELSPVSEATAADFAAGHDSGTLTIPAGDVRAELSLLTVDDKLGESDEEVVITISYVLLSIPYTITLNGIIRDAEEYPNVFVFFELNDYDDTQHDPTGIIIYEGGPLIFNVQLSSMSEQTVTVDWNLPLEVASFTGTTSGTVIFNSGETLKKITVNTQDDQQCEGDDEQTARARIWLSNPRNATIMSHIERFGFIQRWVRIFDNDALVPVEGGSVCLPDFYQ